MRRRRTFQLWSRASRTGAATSRPRLMCTPSRRHAVPAHAFGAPAPAHALGAPAQPPHARLPSQAHNVHVWSFSARPSPRSKRLLPLIPSPHPVSPLRPPSPAQLLIGGLRPMLPLICSHYGNHGHPCLARHPHTTSAAHNLGCHSFDLTPSPPQDGATALHYLAAHGNLDLIDALLAKGANINAKDDQVLRAPSMSLHPTLRPMHPPSAAASRHSAYVCSSPLRRSKGLLIAPSCRTNPRWPVAALGTGVYLPARRGMQDPS
jgi:hypothetical protein